MKLTFDKNLFTQIGLDSGSLTMLGGLTHRFLEPGQYRGVAYRGKGNLGSFYINVDQDSPVAQTNIDLAAFDKVGTPTASSSGGSCCGCDDESSREMKFELNPKGYAVFHVSGGAGGYSVLVARAAENPKERNQFDSRELKGEDIFSAVVIRPGKYSIANALAKGKGEVSVSYPKVGKTPYRPPAPVDVQCSTSGFEPSKLEIQPGQALLFHCKVPSRIKLELLTADDGPGRHPEPARSGWRKAALPSAKAKG